MSVREKIIRIFFYEKDTILYAVVSLENAKIVAGPVSTEKHTKIQKHYLMQHHHISDETGFRLSFCELKVFVSGNSDALSYDNRKRTDD